MKLFTMFIMLLGMSCATITTAAPVKTVDYVDVQRYLGVWYEIASFPQWFQRNCFCTRAKYSLNENGSLAVLNSCNKGSEKGALSQAHGTAKIVDVRSNSKLKVSFFWPFSGDYWIIGLDVDYRYVVISNPKRSSLWILSRTPQMDPKLYEEALAIAQNQGLDLAKLKVNNAENCSYPQDLLN